MLFWKSLLRSLAAQVYLNGEKLDQIIVLLTKEGKQMAQIDDELTQLTSDVAAERTAVDSAVTMLNGITAQIDAAVAAAAAAGATPAQLQAVTDLSASVKQQTADLGNAVAANTPVPAAPNPSP